MGKQRDRSLFARDKVEYENFRKVRLGEGHKGLVRRMGQITRQPRLVSKTHHKALGKAIIERLDVVARAPLDGHNGIDLAFESDKLLGNFGNVRRCGGFLVGETNHMPESRFFGGRVPERQ